jgi:hypothetical protein
LSPESGWLSGAFLYFVERLVGCLNPVIGGRPPQSSDRFSMFQLVLANFVPPKHRVVLTENKGLCRITARTGGFFVCNLHINFVFVVQIATMGVRAPKLCPDFNELKNTKSKNGP